LAAATFLALAHTFRGGGHIRVTLLIHLLPPSWQRMFTFATLIIFTAMVTWGTYYLCHLVWESWHFEELSQGYIAIPMWIPQLPMALGAVIFLISLLDDIVSLVMSRTPSFLNLEE
jgi:TRAP-type C4-dicarboxylate transport system permease small subunit